MSVKGRKQKNAYGNWKCKYCEKIFRTRQELRSHSLSHKNDKNYGYSGHPKGYHLSEETRRKISDKAKGRKVSEETKSKISETCKKNKLSGGYRKGSGRGKKGTYKGFYCDSSWELAYVIYNIDHNIKFERNEELFPYEFNGKQHNYKPDFIENGIYVEIKGYYTNQVRAKEAFFPYQLKYIDKESIKPYLSYVIEKYGKDFYNLYEDKTYSVCKNYSYTCPFCGKVYKNRTHKKNCLRLQAKAKTILSKKQSEVISNNEERKKYIEDGKIDRTGRINLNVLSSDIWEKRKNLILNCDVDLNKFGCLSEIERKTGLTRRQIKLTIEKFNIQYKKR